MRSASIIRSGDLRNENRLRILNTLRQYGTRSPSQLSELTGLSPAAISTLCAQMIEQGILDSQTTPAKDKKAARGRPRSLLSLRSDAGFIVTLNLTIDLIRTQRIDYAGNVCQRNELILDTRALSSQALIEQARQCVELACPLELRDQLNHIGVAFQGATKHNSGTLLWSPIVSITDVPLGDELQRAFNVPVSVNNDCRLIAQALYDSHQEKLGDSFAAILFSNGVGLGLYLNGQPFAGTQSSALELGHLQFERDGALCRCGKHGCIEAYAADYGIERMALGNSIQDVPSGRVSQSTMRRLADDAKSGDLVAIQAFTIAGAAIGDGLANLFTFLDPLPVALVGCSEASFGQMRGGIESALRHYPRMDTIKQSSLHCFEDEFPLLNDGLVQNSLSCVDSLLSYCRCQPRGH